MSKLWPLDEAKIRRILEHIPQLTLAVVGDFFLDKYLDIDGRLTEKSLETGLDAHQVVRVRCSPGAGGTVTNNLSALGVGRILAVSVIGDDGEGYELRRELARRRVTLDHLVQSPHRYTPTYMKPMYDDGSGQLRELNRLDIKNRTATPAELQDRICQCLDRLLAQLDAIIVADQVTEPDCGVITATVREHLAELGRQNPDKLIWVDSRANISRFRYLTVKPNYRECLKAAGMDRSELDEEAIDLDRAGQAAAALSRLTQRHVYCTLGSSGMLAVAPDGQLEHVPAFPVSGPVDIVGAGDSTTAGAVCALCTGASPPEAAAFANLVASITIQQLGTTGTTSPQQVLQRWREVAS